MQVYGLYYKDRDGFSLPISDNGHIMIFETEEIARFKAQEYIDKIIGILAPRHEFVRVGVFKKQMIKKDPVKIPEYLRTQYKRQIDTHYVKHINLT